MSETTRRRFIQTASNWAAMAPLVGQQRSPRRPATAVLAYVGTYSSPQGSAPGRGEGIHILEMDPASGALTPRDILRTTASPSWLAFDRTRLPPEGGSDELIHAHLYAASEATTPGSGSGSVSAYSVDRATGGLALINAVSSEGAGP